MIHCFLQLVDASQQSSRIVNSLKEAFICESNQRTCYDDMAPSTSAARPNSLELATSCPSSSSSSTPIITSTDQISFTPQSTFQGACEHNFALTKFLIFVTVVRFHAAFNFCFCGTHHPKKSNLVLFLDQAFEILLSAISIIGVLKLIFSSYISF